MKSKNTIKVRNNINKDIINPTTIKNYIEKTK